MANAAAAPAPGRAGGSHDPFIKWVADDCLAAFAVVRHGAARKRLRLPGLKAIHRLVTGVPSPDEPPRDWSPLGAFARNLAWLVLFMAATGVAMAALPHVRAAAPAFLILSVFSMAGIIGRLRRMVVGDVHEAGHGIVVRWYRQRGVSKRRARWISETILDLGSALTLTRNGQD